MFWVTSDQIANVLFCIAAVFFVIGVFSALVLRLMPKKYEGVK